MILKVVIAIERQGHMRMRSIRVASPTPECAQCDYLQCTCSIQLIFINRLRLLDVMAFAGSSCLRLVPLLLAAAHLYFPLTDGQQGTNFVQQLCCMIDDRIIIKIPCYTVGISLQLLYLATV